MSNWFYNFNKLNFSHGIYAAVMLLPFYFTEYLDYAALSVVSFYYGRELNDAQRKAHINPHLNPFKKVLPWQWHAASQWDYWSVLVTAAIYIGVYYYA